MFNPEIVIVHCTATPDYLPNDPGFDRFRAKDIDQWHKQRGWSGIGYHFVVTRAGAIEKGRPSNKIGAHCENFNQHSLGVCYVGTKILLPKQQNSIVLLYAIITKLFGISLEKWYCHNQFDKSKLCPGFDQKTLHKIIKTNSLSNAFL
jgi:N-acetylmuramoyl-L-alanine amidase